MEKDFVPYNRALRLKALGFDEPTLYHWHNSSKEIPFTNEVFNPNCRPKTNSGIKEIGEENHTWSAPTFSQVFRWFRKTYPNIFFEVKQSSWDGVYSIFFGFKVHIQDKDKTIGAGGFLSYEVAELNCLDELLEVVEN